MSSDLTLLLGKISCPSLIETFVNNWKQYFDHKDDVKKDIEFLSKCWNLHGRPIYLFLIREQNLRGPQGNELLELLSQFKQGYVNNIPVRMERLQTIISSACIEHLDFLNEDSHIEFMALKELENDNSQYKSLSDLPKLMNLEDETTASLEEFAKTSLNDLICMLHSTTNRFTKALILHELVNRYGMKLQIQESTLEDLFSQLSGD